MTVELVVLLSIFAFVLLGVFLGDLGPIQTFRHSAPRLGARIEEHISIGDGFRQSKDGKGVSWNGPVNGQ